MKRLLKMVLTVSLVLVLAIHCYASGTEGPVVSPRYAYIRDSEVILTINEDTGIAKCEASCDAFAEYTVQVVYKLQKNTGTYWATLKTWYTSGTETAGLYGECGVVSGYTYRAYVTFSVYDSAGNLLDSDTVTYNCVYPAQ